MGSGGRSRVLQWALAALLLVWLADTQGHTEPSTEPTADSQRMDSPSPTAWSQPVTFIPPVTGLPRMKSARAAARRVHTREICSTWGDFHYKTFDGDIFRFPGLCNYVFSAHCTAAYEDFSIQMRRSLVGSRPTITHIIIEVQGLVLDLLNGSVLVNGRRKELPYGQAGLLVEHSNGFVKVQARLLFNFLWNGADHALVGLNPKYANQTCGLCGDFNGLPAINEFYLHNTKLTPLQFGNLQKLDGPTEQCQDALASSADNCTDEEDFCYRTLHSPAFSECNTLLDAAPYVAACVQDLCRCPSCPCDTFTEYSRQCAHAGGQPLDWRSPSLCPRACPLSMQYQECSSPCVDTCSNPQRSQLCETHCTDGCFCPPGTVLDDVTHSGCLALAQCPCTHRGRTYTPGASFNTSCSSCTCSGGLWQCQDLPCPGSCSVQGGSHISTYDEKLYDVHGDCSYVLSKRCADSTFTVLVELRKCGLTDTENCLRMVTLILNGGDMTIQVQANGRVFMNSIYTQLPMSAANITIFNPTSFFILVQTAFGLQLQVQLVPLMQVFLRLDPSYRGQMCGLCGNFNQNQADDFTALSGVVEGTGAAFSNTWKTQASCPNSKNSFEDPCSLSVENENYAQHWCSRMTDPAGAFAACHSTVNPAPFYSNCMFDTCNCEKSEDCLCAALSAYVHACAAKGVLLRGWRDGVCAKYMKNCPKSQSYAYVVSSCTPTCRALSQADVTCEVPFVPVDGCTCAAGTFLNDVGVCVPAHECPCYLHGAVVAPGEVMQDGSVLCSCATGKLTCLGDTLQNSAGCAAPMVYLDCSNASAGTSGVECLRSCHTLDMDCFSSHCVSGCVCPDGLVADGKGGCVAAEDCPCMHNEASYRPGETIQVDCNTCTCRSRRWECSQAPCLSTCVAYGDGHFLTFDGERYAFEGSCEYTLAQDYCGGNASAGGTFQILTENVPCGTTGTTCSKAIKIFLEGYELTLHEGTFKVVERGQGGALPYKIRSMGIFLVIETRGGMVVSWDRKTSVFIRLQQHYKGKVCGLCGNFDGNALNDFTTRSQAVVGNVLEFGNSWKFSPTCPDALVPRDPCTANPYRKAWAQRQCSIINSAVFEACHSQVEPTKYYEACVGDACACDSGGDCECFCTAVAAYAQACHDAGVCVSWRTPDICPLFCDYYNSQGECEWHYQPCGAPCLKTCRNPSGHCLVELPGLEGCYPKCPPGQPFFNEDQMKCVAQCGCYDEDGNYHDINTTVPTSENCQSCRCTPAGLQCAHSLAACTCTYEGETYHYKDVIYNTTDGLGGCLTAICGDNGTVIRKAVDCPEVLSTTPFTFTTSAAPVSTTGSEPAPSTVCVREVCRWSAWYDSGRPESGMGGGDFETFQNLRQRGYPVCQDPAAIECQAEMLPGVSLQTVGQKVDCDVARGLVCRNREQSPPLCHNYELRVLCCDHVPCGPSTSLATSTLSSQPETTSETSLPTLAPSTAQPWSLPSLSQTPAPKKTTPPVTLTFRTTVTLSTQATSTPLVVPVTSSASSTLAPGATTCQPRCQWTEWFDTSYPKSESAGEDIETFDRVRAAGGEICAQPQAIECEAEMFPGKPVDQLGQRVTCDLHSGLVCHNKDQEQPFPMCFNYRIRAQCCSSDHCRGTATLPAQATTRETATTAAQAPSKQPQSTGSPGVTSAPLTSTTAASRRPRLTSTVVTGFTESSTVPSQSSAPSTPEGTTEVLPTSVTPPPNTAAPRTRSMSPPSSIPEQTNTQATSPTATSSTTAVSSTPAQTTAWTTSPTATSSTTVLNSTPAQTTAQTTSPTATSSTTAVSSTPAQTTTRTTSPTATSSTMQASSTPAQTTTQATSPTATSTTAASSTPAQTTTRATSPTATSTTAQSSTPEQTTAWTTSPTATSSTTALNSTPVQTTAQTTSPTAPSSTTAVSSTPAQTTTRTTSPTATSSTMQASSTPETIHTTLALTTGTTFPITTKYSTGSSSTPGTSGKTPELTTRTTLPKTTEHYTAPSSTPGTPGSTSELTTRTTLPTTTEHSTAPSSTPGTPGSTQELTTRTTLPTTTEHSTAPSSTPGTPGSTRELTTRTTLPTTTEHSTAPSSTPGTPGSTRELTTRTTLPTTTEHSTAPSSTPGTPGSTRELTTRTTLPTTTEHSTAPSSTPGTPGSTRELTTRTTLPTTTEHSTAPSSTPGTPGSTRELTTRTTLPTTTEHSTAPSSTPGTPGSTRELTTRTTLPTTTEHSTAPSSTPGTPGSTRELTTRTTLPTTTEHSTAPSSTPGTPGTTSELTARTTLPTTTKHSTAPSSTPGTPGSTRELTTRTTLPTTTEHSTAPSSTPGTPGTTSELTARTTLPTTTKHSTAPSSTPGTPGSTRELNTRTTLPMTTEHSTASSSTPGTPGSTRELTTAGTPTPERTTVVLPTSVTPPPNTAAPRTRSTSPPSASPSVTTHMSPATTTTGLPTSTAGPRPTEPLTTSLTSTRQLSTSRAQPSTPASQTPLSTAATATPSLGTTRCQPKCEWTEWFDMDSPTSGIQGGDSETYDNIRAAGGALCPQPVRIECRAENYPEVSIDQVGQVVSCSLETGLVCRNKDQRGGSRMCFNYNVRFLCCNDYSRCPGTAAPPATSTMPTPRPRTKAVTTTATRASPLPKPITRTTGGGSTLSTTTGGISSPPTTLTTAAGFSSTSGQPLPGTLTTASRPSPPSHSPTALPETPHTPATSGITVVTTRATSPSTTAPVPPSTAAHTAWATSNTTSAPEGSTAGLTPTPQVRPTACRPRCAWTGWLDQSLPIPGALGGEYETYANIRASGVPLCEQPQALECRAADQPSKPLQELEQVVSCSLDVGLVCRNQDQEEPEKICLNYQIRVLCCDTSHCTTTQSSTTASVPGTGFVPTSTTALPLPTHSTWAPSTSPTVTAPTTAVSSTPAQTTAQSTSPTATSSTTAPSSTQVQTTTRATSPTANSSTMQASSTPAQTTAQTTFPMATSSTMQASSTPAQTTTRAISPTATSSTMALRSTPAQTTTRATSPTATSSTTVLNSTPAQTTTRATSPTATSSTMAPSSTPAQTTTRATSPMATSSTMAPSTTPAQTTTRATSPTATSSTTVLNSTPAQTTTRATSPTATSSTMAPSSTPAQTTTRATSPTATSSTTAVSSTPAQPTTWTTSPTATSSTTVLNSTPAQTTTRATSPTATSSTMAPSSTPAQTTTRATSPTATSSTMAPSSTPAQTTTRATSPTATSSTTAVSSTPAQPTTWTTSPTATSSTTVLNSTPAQTTAQTTSPTATASTTAPRSTPAQTTRSSLPTTTQYSTAPSSTPGTITTAPELTTGTTLPTGTTYASAHTSSVLTPRATSSMAPGSTMVPSSTMGTARITPLLSTPATSPVAPSSNTATSSRAPSVSTTQATSGSAGTALPPSTVPETTHVPAASHSSPLTFTMSTMSFTGHSTLGSTAFSSPPFSPSPCFCQAFGQLFSPGDVIYNRTDRAGCSFYAVCSQHCAIDRFQGPCTTPFPAASSTPVPSPSLTPLTPGCNNTVPPRQVNETWPLENCMRAKCEGDNKIVLLEPEPVPNVTCVNNHPPVRVENQSQPCHFHYECECSCSGWGHWHYSTFDGTSYSFSGNCTYVLVKEIRPRYGNLTILLYNQYCEAGGASCPRALAVHYRSMEIVLSTTTSSNRKEECLILFNQERVSRSFSQGGVSVSISTGTRMTVDIPAIGVSVTFDGHIFQILLSYSHFHYNTEGQCGTCTNNQQDECRRPDGTVAPSCPDMAHGWLVPGSSSEGCRVPSRPTPSTSPEVMSSTASSTTCPRAQLCEVLLSPVFRECHRFVPPGPFFETCKQDSCQDTSPCQNLEAYAALCLMRGVCTNWRNATGGQCEFLCPPTKVYKPCGPVQPPSCDSWRRLATPSRGLTEGCFCPDGQMLFSWYMDECVPDCPCVGPNGYPKFPGERWLSNCEACVCEKSVSVHCEPVRCEAQSSPLKCERPGFVAVTRPQANNQCCNETLCVCNTKTCPQKFPTCRPEEEVTSTQDEDNCCPSYSCEPKLCTYNGTVYGVGATFPGAIPCHTCTCVALGTRNLTVQCEKDICNTACPQGFQYRKKDGECCGKCVQASCLTTEGQLVQVNETWINSRVDNCTVYYCAEQRGVLVLTPQPVPCPLVSSCRGVLRRVGCCYSCEEEDKCRVQFNTITLQHQGCQSEAAVNVTFCEGLCPGTSTYSMEAQSMQHQCACCQEARTHEESMMLRCPDGTALQHTFTLVDECHCSSFCASPSAASTNTPV